MLVIERDKSYIIEILVFVFNVSETKLLPISTNIEEKSLQYALKDHEFTN
jgi:hypothetical protein